MAVDESSHKEITDLQDRLAELDRERASVLAALEQLKRRPTVEVQSTPTSQMADVLAGPAAFSNAEKVARKDHLQAIAERLTKFAKNVIVPKGGMGAKQRNQATAAPATVLDGEERVIVATGRYLGAGFDDARLDTLFLTMPIILARHPRTVCGPTAPVALSQTGGLDLRLRRCGRTPAGQNGLQARGWLPVARLRRDPC